MIPRPGKKDAVMAKNTNILDNKTFTTITKVKAFLIDFPLFLTSWFVLGEYFFENT
jgi:hypothetical protein